MIVILERKVKSRMVNSSIHLLVGGMVWQLGILQQVSAVNGSKSCVNIWSDSRVQDMENWPLDKLNHIQIFKSYMTSWSSYIEVLHCERPHIK